MKQDWNWVEEEMDVSVRRGRRLLYIGAMAARIEAACKGRQVRSTRLGLPAIHALAAGGRWMGIARRGTAADKGPGRGRGRGRVADSHRFHRFDG
jgi:hypothetical protein